MILTVSREDGEDIDKRAADILKEIYGKDNVRIEEGKLQFINLKLIDNLNLVRKIKKLGYIIQVN